MPSLELYPGFKNPLLGSPRHDLPKHVAVIGAGTIGPDIGYYLKSALPDITLTLVDVRAEALEEARARLEGYAAKGVARGKLKAEVAARVTANIVTSTHYDVLRGTGTAPVPADLVIEAATEHIPLKKAIFSAIEERVAPEAVVTSNTSSIPAAQLFDDMRFPNRATVTHFFAPAWRNPAVEVVTWEKGDRAVVDYLRWLFAVTGKTPVVTADVVCFMLDRIFDNWCNESGHLLDRATTVQVDHVAEEFAAAGPFFVLDMSNGNPIIVETNTRQMQEGEAYRPAPIFQSVRRWVVAAKPGGASPEIDPETRAAVRDRLLGILFSQSLDIVSRRIGTPEDLDLGCTLALAFKEGPLAMMTRMGSQETERVLRRLDRERPGLPGLDLLEHVPSPGSVDRWVLVDRVDDVVVLTIRRPAQLNALTDEVTEELLRALVRYEKDPTVVGFVIVGFGTRAFCAGADVGRFTDMVGDEVASAQYSRDCSRLLVHLDGMTKPVVAAINGLALGGGMELAIRCHDRVASPRAYFQLPEVTLGIVPGIGGMVVPYRKWPAAASVWTDMILYAERLSAARALEIGMLSGVEEDYEALVLLAAERARALAGSLPLQEPDMTPLLEEVVEVGEPVARDGAVLSREVLEIAVQAIHAGIRAPDLASALEAGYQAFGRVAATRAAAEGIGSFMSGKKPDFSGM